MFAITSLMRIRRTIILLLLSVAIVVAARAYLLGVKQQAEFTKAISYAHSMTKSLEVYVADHHDFPESLEAMFQNW